MSLPDFRFGSKPQNSEPSAACVYLRGDTVYMHPLVKTTAGVFMFVEPVVQLAKDDTQVGACLLDLLSKRRSVVDHPTLWQGLVDPLLKAAKAQSFNAFAASAKLVEAELDDKRVSLRPTRNGGRKEGFVHLNEKRRLCRPTAQEIRKALGATFADCA